MNSAELHTVRLPAAVDVIAPDGSEIRLLANAAGASVCHCTLLPGGVSKPIAHRSVEEVWFGLEGRGEVWRSHAGREQIVEIVAGVSLNIPVGASFQFRNTNLGVALNLFFTGSCKLILTGCTTVPISKMS